MSNSISFQVEDQWQYDKRLLAQPVNTGLKASTNWVLKTCIRPPHKFLRLRAMDITGGLWLWHTEIRASHYSMPYDCPVWVLEDRCPNVIKYLTHM